MGSSDAESRLPQRLLRRAAQSLRLPLREVAEYWHAGRLSVLTSERAEPRVLPPETLIFDGDRVLVDGSPIADTTPEAVCAVLNKPKHVTCTARDPNGKADLSPFLRAMPAGCFPVGRLDRDTTGLLLFTNDGDLASAVLRPDHGTRKYYWLWLDEPFPDDDPRLAALVEGVRHNGELLKAQGARVLARSEHATELELTLTQGKKRQIRHMCFALGLHLVHLHRRAIGPLRDEGLELGAWRRLDASEVEALWTAVGGRAQLRARKVHALLRHAAEARTAGAPHARLEQWLAQELAGEPARPASGVSEMDLSAERVQGRTLLGRLVLPRH